jgi:hypothetical protein
VHRRLPVVPVARFLAGFFLVAGTAALVVGVHDASLAGGRLGVLFPSVLLVLAGVLFIGAVWKLLPIARPRTWPKGQQPRCKEPMPAAFLVSILLGVYIFFGARTGVGAQQALVTVTAVVFMAAGFLGFVLFWSEIKVSTARVGVGVALTVAGLAIGTWEFWYQNQYVPSHLDRAVSVQVSLKKLGVQGHYDVLSATLGYQNVGGRAVVVLRSDYTLTGSTVVPCHREPRATDVAGYFANPLPDPQRARLMSDVWEVKPSTVLAAGRFVTDTRRLGPNAPGSRQMLLYVRHAHRYQLLRLRAQVFAISTSLPLADEAPHHAGIDDHDLYDLWKLGESSWFQDLLSGRRGWIVTRYEVVSTPPRWKEHVPSPDLRVTARSPDPSWSGNAPSKRQIKKLFENAPPVDTTETFADSELPLAPVRAQTRAKLEAEKVPKACMRFAINR